jgi:hypothetical protein
LTGKEAMQVLEYLVIFLPFTMFGTFTFLMWVREKMMVKKGFYKVFFRLPNFRKIHTYIKPDKDSIKTKDNTYPFSNSIGYVYFNGNTPEVEYDVNGEQINFLKDETSEFDPKGLSALGFRTFNYGKKQGKKEEKIILLGVFVAAGASVLSALLLWGTMGGAF